MNTTKTLLSRTSQFCTRSWTRLVVLSVLAGLFAAIAVPVHVH